MQITTRFFILCASFPHVTSFQTPAFSNTKFLPTFSSSPTTTALHGRRIDSFKQLLTTSNDLRKKLEIELKEEKAKKKSLAAEAKAATKSATTEARLAKLSPSQKARRIRWQRRRELLLKPLALPLKPFLATYNHTLSAKNRFKLSNPKSYKLAKVVYFSAVARYLWYLHSINLENLRKAMPKTPLQIVFSLLSQPPTTLPFSTFYKMDWSKSSSKFTYDVLCRKGNSFEIRKFPKAEYLTPETAKLARRYVSKFPAGVDPAVLLPLLNGLKGENVNNVVMRAAATTNSGLENAAIIVKGVVPIFYLYLLWKMVRSIGGKGGGGNEIGKLASRRSLISANSLTSFADVEGIDGAKGSIMELVDTIKNPAKYASLGARAPRGLLMCGPPGTGKTMLAKATAAEAGVPCIYCSGSDFVELYVGMGAKRVRGVFDKAAKASPCVLFVDELDAVGKSREKPFRIDGGGSDESDRTLNQLLASMDGLEALEGVVVVAATNRYDVLDPALTRPGRFDRIVRVELPDAEGREKIMKVHAKNLVVSKRESIDYKRFAALLPNTSGAEISGIVNEAAICAVRRDSGGYSDAAGGVENRDFDSAIVNFYESRKRSTLGEKLLKNLKLANGSVN